MHKRTKVLIGSTIPAHAMQGEDWGWWCDNAEGVTATNLQHNILTSWCAVLQYDDRGREIFKPLTDRLNTLGAHIVWFSLDLGFADWDTSTRLTAICTGRNLLIDRGQREDVDYIYFADSDIEAPDDIIPRLLEVNERVTGGAVDAYTFLDGPKADKWGQDVHIHWNTAGSLLVHNSVYRRVPWRIDLQSNNINITQGVTDDPVTQAEMRTLGYPTYVRHDIELNHHPKQIKQTFEERTLDRTVYSSTRSSEIPTHVVIPYRGDARMAWELVELQLRQFGGVKQIHCFDNTDEPLEHIQGTTTYHRPGATITEMWNEGWDIVLDIDPVANLAILNDDIVVRPNFLTHMAKMLRSDDNLWLVYPDYEECQTTDTLPCQELVYTKGSARHHGMCGWAFMVKAEARRLGLPPIDEQFRWWCGDDDLAFAIEACGHRQACCVGLHARHLTSITARKHPELDSVIKEDVRRFTEKWGEEVNVPFPRWNWWENNGHS